MFDHLFVDRPVGGVSVAGRSVAGAALLDRPAGGGCGGGRSVLAEAVSVVAALDVASGGAGSVSDDGLLGGVPVLERARRVVEAALGSALAELDRRGTTDERFGHRTAVWFALEVNCSRADARRRVHVGRRLARLEVVRDALAEGDVSFDHARVLADLAVPRNAEVLERLQGDLVALAGVVGFERWRSEVVGIVDLLDPDGGHRPGPDTSTLQLTTGFGGSVELTGTFDGLDGATVRDAVDTHADRLRLHYRDQVRAGILDTVPTLAELRAEALTTLVRHGTAAGRTGNAPVTELTLVAHATDPLGRTHPTHHTPGPCPSGPCPSGPGPSGPGPSGPGLSGPGLATTSALSDTAVRTLCCDPVLRTIVLDSLGSPLDLGRRTRIVPPGLRRALVVRDGGCVFPGCDAPPAWCDAHHVVHWADGGPTSAANLALVCRFHHGVTHRNGWTMTTDPDHDQHFTWTRPDGTHLHSQRHGVPRE